VVSECNEACLRGQCARNYARVRWAHAELVWRADEYTWIFALTVIFAFIAAFGIGALQLPCVLCFS
jgi:hypothetical protein